VFKSVIKEEIQVPAHIDYLGELRNFVTKAGRKHGFSDTVVNAFKLSIDEAATNIIKHAYRDWEGMIKMRVIIKSSSLTVILIDQGKYFDPSRIQDPDLKRYVDIGKKGGLGIFIMRKLLDEIDYRHTEEGNELRLTKFRGTPKKAKRKIPSPSLPSSLKTRYSIITVSILTSLVAIVYFYFFFRHSAVVLNEFIKEINPVCQTISKEVLQEGKSELNPLYVDLKVQEYIAGRPEIYKMVVTDNGDTVISSTEDSLFSTPFTIPENHQKPRQELVSYKDNKGKTIYAFVSEVIAGDVSKTKVGTVYLEVKKEYVSKQVAALRLKDLQLTALILLFGYLGVFVLVYIILNPFRKLANWVKEFGHGEVKDEIDFDTSDEVGEIAKAFSDITDTLRDSQKNLAEQERIQKEMQLAQDIQQTLLPAEVPKLEGYEIGSFYEAAKEVGGDYFDFIEVDKDTLGIVVADVSGKGVPGSLIMTMIRTALRTEARSIRSASEVLTRVNDFVVNDMKKGMFVTLFYVIVDSKRRRINYASAGHNPMILYRKNTEKTYYLNPRGFPIGISLPDPDLFKKSIESDTIQMAEDDILIIYTDGITEAMNNRRELFSEERLQKVIQQHGDMGASEFIEELKEEIHTFTEGFEQNDDITLVAIKEKSTPEKIELKRAQKAHKMILQGKNIRDACEECGITVYAYYNKYKKIFEEEGVDAFEIDETISVESKHLSIEEKTKIYDIIKLHPEFGAKRISEELNTERYSNTVINENRIYDELVRSRLNTRQLREAYIARSGRKKRMKPPGTPMMTLDGQIILDKRFEEVEPAPYLPETKAKKEKPPIQREEEVDPVIDQPFEEEESSLPENRDDNFYLESLMTMPIEDLLKKQRKGKKPSKKSGKEKKKKAGMSENEIKQDKSDSSIFDELGENQITLKNSIDDSALDENTEIFELHNQKDALDDTTFEDDVSFSDIWEDTEENLEIELEGEKESLEQKVAEEPTKNTETSNEELETGSTGVDIDEILSETNDGSLDTDFDFLIDETTFKDELVDDLSESDENLTEKSPKNKGALKKEKNKKKSKAKKPDQKSETYIDQILEEVEEESQEAEPSDLADDELADVEFNFKELLEEIESDISLIDGDEQEHVGADIGQLESIEKEAEQLRKEINKERRKEKSLSGQKNNSQMKDKNLILGLRFYREKNYEKAIEQFVAVVENYPDFKEAYSILGNAYYHHNMVEKAVEIYSKVKELDPADTDSYENTGVIYANQGKFTEAIDEWEMVLKIDPERKDVLTHINEAKQILKKN